jgi:hypothetical protein
MVLPYGPATFNRVGAYAKMQYKNKKGIDLAAQYHQLREIRGQGSFALRDMSQIKLNAGFLINEWIQTKKMISLQLGANLQRAKRSNGQAIENMDLESNQWVLGLRCELVDHLELMLGYVMQTSKGYDYLPTRNAYSEVTYFNRLDYDMNQQMGAAGIRYHFNPKTYLCILYQQSRYDDKLQRYADFSINQFGIIYNLSF